MTKITALATTVSEGASPVGVSLADCHPVSAASATLTEGAAGVPISQLLKPSEVLDEAAAAARRAEELADRNRELHFYQGAAGGRVIVEVRDLKGRVICAIPPSLALDVMAGLEDVASLGVQGA